MPRILAIDWDRCEARYVLAMARGAQVQIEAAGAVVLPEPEEGAGLPAAEIGARLGEALAAQRVGRAMTLVGVDRASNDLMALTLPPASEAELPELVANEVLRESQVGGEQAVMDFVPLGDDPTEPRKVTAAVLSAERLEQITATCAAAGLRPNRLLLRSFATASLFLRTTPPPEEICLLVNPVAEEVDLTVLVAGKVAFSRTARLPRAADEAKLTEWLLAEIHRTLGVATQSAGEIGIVECVYIFGRAEEHRRLREQIRDELLLPARSFDPFDALEVPAERVPEGPGRFASLLGMILDEAHGGRHAIDLLHPRRPPRQLHRWQVIALAVAATLAVVLAIGGVVWHQLRNVDAENAALAAELKRLDGLARQYAKQQKVYQAVHDWRAGDVSWLEELREMSERFPPQKDAVVLRLAMSSVSSGGGTIAFQGLVRDPAMIVRMEFGLRDPYHSVHSRRIQEGARQEDYARLFDMSMSVAPRDQDEYLAGRGKQP